MIAEDVTTLEEPGRSDEPCGADSSPSVEEVTPPLSVESDVSDQVAEAEDLESHREETIVEGCGHDGPLIPSEDDAVAVTPVIEEGYLEHRGHTVSIPSPASPPRSPRPRNPGRLAMRRVGWIAAVMGH